MFNCKKITQLISLSHEQTLSKMQSFQVKLHIMMCPMCKGFERNNQKIEQLVKEFCKNK